MKKAFFVGKTVVWNPASTFAAHRLDGCFGSSPKKRSFYPAATVGTRFEWVSADFLDAERPALRLHAGYRLGRLRKNLAERWEKIQNGSNPKQKKK
ncbi:MAG: hypothetical protein J4215_04215 [Candidatus Diapherotrites archaeon]|uniref:Uncharacterized protein n=1 Tax=Candidatus Iainarchaeum sp. TaxID=3101447 RepID=A0A8T4L348_9ARCH|nr:hypothetical protein [Candidatus Diapherotrites archaeon]